MYIYNWLMFGVTLIHTAATLTPINTKHGGNFTNTELRFDLVVAGIFIFNFF